MTSQHKYLSLHQIDRLNKVHAGRKLRDHILAQIDIWWWVTTTLQEASQ